MTEGTGAVYFDLWENRTGNILAEFATQDEALTFVHNAVKRGGLADVLSWSLHRSDQDAPIAYGKALVALVEHHLAA